MCNYKHFNSKIPRIKHGKGYKIFKSGFNTVFQCIPYREKRGWIDWDLAEEYGDGFCFFFVLKEAQRLLNHLNDTNPLYYEDCEIYEIEYKNAIARHKENNILSTKSYDIGLCKSFKIGSFV